MSLLSEKHIQRIPEATSQDRAVFLLKTPPKQPFFGRLLMSKTVTSKFTGLVCMLEQSGKIDRSPEGRAVNMNTRSKFTCSQLEVTNVSLLTSTLIIQRIKSIDPHELGVF